MTRSASRLPPALVLLVGLLPGTVAAQADVVAEKAEREAVRLSRSGKDAGGPAAGMTRGISAQRVRAMARKSEAEYRIAIEADADDPAARSELASLYLDRADSLADVGAYGEAERYFRLATDLLPDSPDAHHSLAVFYFGLERLEASLAAETRAHEVDPGNAVTVSNLALLNERLGRMEEAERHYRRAAEMAPDDADLAWNAAYFLREQPGGRAEAERLYDRAMELAPDRQDLHWSAAFFYLYEHDDLESRARAEVPLLRALDLAETAADSIGPAEGLGDLYSQLGRLEESEHYYRVGLEADPGNTWIMNDLAVFLEKQDRSREAVELYGRAAGLAPSDGDAAAYLANQGDLLRALGEPERAEAAYRTAVERDPGSLRAWNGLGLARAALENYDGAVQAYLRAEEVDPTSVYPSRNMGDALRLWSAGEEGGVQAARLRERAAAAYARAMEKDPTHVWAPYGMGLLRSLEGRDSEAEEWFGRAAGAAPTDSAAAEMHVSVALFWSGRGRTEAAEATYRRAIALDPEHPTALNNLAWLLYGQGRLEEAGELSDRSLATPRATAADLPYSRDTRANIWLDAGEPERALELFELIRAEMEEPDVVNHLGRAMALLELGRGDEAQAAFEAALAVEERILSQDFLLEVLGYSERVVERVERLRALSGA